jgi:hypothetical protein
MPLSPAATEEPDFEVLKTIDDVELRRYSPYVVAEVVLRASAADAGNQAFPILAGYIFGKNKGERKFAMTAPVTQTAMASPGSGSGSAPTSSGGSVDLEPTAPVTRTAAPGGMLVQFVLPRGVGLATAPEPDDPRVKLRLVPATTRAAIRYSGRWSESNDEEHLARLRSVLQANGVVTEGEPVLARYNSPMTPWFMRRNEIWLGVR